MLLSSILTEFYHSHTQDSYAHSSTTHQLAKRAEKPDAFFIVSACLIPVLVLLSGVFAGLTLGYMSLDETQLNVLASSGTAKQREYANKIIPVRKNGHLLLVSLLLANMITNETLPVISDRVLGGGVPAVAVSTVLIVIFSEIIPQSICTRHGLYIGAKCAIPVRILMYSLWIVAWPVAKLLEMILGPHHGIIYRRGELKELINMHSSVSPHGGDLKHDTVTIIGHTLDLQEKVVKDAMTPIEKVFMLPIDARLDYETLRRVCESGHSRVPVYDEVDVKVGAVKRAKKIVGILLVKQCVLLDPKEATPLRSIPLNKVPSVPFDESLLGILNHFQEGRSHMAIVSLFSKGRAASVKEAVKLGLTRRFLNSVGLGEDDDEKAQDPDLERAWGDLRNGKIRNTNEDNTATTEKTRRFTAGIGGKEQAMPADAVLARADADDFLRGIDTDVNPLGIITLEDVLEELIGEEILDEFDLTGPQAASSYVPPSARRAAEEQNRRTRGNSLIAPVPIPATPPPTAVRGTSHLPSLPLLPLPSFPSIFNRSRSQPGMPRVDAPALPEHIVKNEKEPMVGGVSHAYNPSDLANDDNHTRASTMVDNDTEPPSGLPAIMISEERGRPPSAPPAVTTDPTKRPASPVPRVTEAILQTQTRRRAQLQQQVHAHSASSLVVPSTPAAFDQLPAQRQVPKAGFKSSPLTPIPSRLVDGTAGNEKVANSDPNLKEPKDGL